MTAVLEVNDRRHFDAEGSRNVEDLAEEQLTVALAEAPKVYGPDTPILDRLLVLRTKADVVFEGTTIIIPDIAKKDPNMGVVVAVSPVLKENGVPLNGLWMPCHVKEGDVVTFTQFTDEQFKDEDGNIFVLLSIWDIKKVKSVSYAVASH